MVSVFEEVREGLNCTKKTHYELEHIPIENGQKKLFLEVFNWEQYKLFCGLLEKIFITVIRFCVFTVGGYLWIFCKPPVYVGCVAVTLISTLLKMKPTPDSR
ncbi:hypothetical protein RUM44_006324 [Polyplax serrata]|uniref:Uncharacterized protein n=1 Tax=Polyplax serrata TaxID=468196 RepID=A0ABR1AHT3_POLSC